MIAYFSLPRFLQSHFTEDVCVRGGTEGQSEWAAAEKRRASRIQCVSQGQRRL